MYASGKARYTHNLLFQTMEETFEFPKEILAPLRGITFGDIMDSPLAQPFAMSCMGSIVNTLQYRKEPLDRGDEILKNIFIQAYKAIPYEERMALFQQCNVLNNKRKEARN